MTITYEKLGASAQKPDVKAAIAQLGKGLFPGAFCDASPDVFTGSAEHCLLSHADGAGTKSIVAYLHYLKHTDPAIFEGIAQDSLVMNTDDMLCVGATGPFLLSNTIGRNMKLIPGEVISAIVLGYRKMVATLAQHGVDIVIAGGETADVGDSVRTLIVDSTLTTRMAHRDFIDASQVRAGQVIVAFASNGQASYEGRPNSGVGSNGMTAMRHQLLAPLYRTQCPEAYAPQLGGLAYNGKYEIDDPIPGLNMTVGEALLSPTRTYAPLIRAILANGRDGISAIFHNTGGGQTKCLNFGNSIRYVKDALFPEAPFFQFLRQENNYPYREMLRTFNMGYRMEIVCEKDRAADLMVQAQSFGINAKIIGRTEVAAGTSLVIETPDGPQSFQRA